MKAKLVLLLAVAVWPFVAAPASVFEIHAVEAKGSAKTTAYTIDNAGHKGTVHLNNDVLIDRSALAGARVTQETVAVTSAPKPEQRAVPAIKFTFTNDGMRKFAEVATALLGRQVGVVIDGKLVATPAVRQTLPRNSVTLTGSFTKEEAGTLVGRINSGK